MHANGGAQERSHVRARSSFLRNPSVATRSEKSPQTRSMPAFTWRETSLRESSIRVDSPRGPSDSQEYPLRFG
jgi:hypothetical protein